MKKHYFLTGFMGAGKSHVLKHLKEKIRDINFYELDALVAHNWQVKPHELGDELGNLIDKFGMAAFRVREKKELQELLKRPMPSFTSLGGGTLEHNPELLSPLSQKHAVVIWLNTPFEVCLKNIREDQKDKTRTTRPLALLSDGELWELYQKREKNYKKAPLHLSVSQFLQCECQNDLRHLLAH